MALNETHSSNEALDPWGGKIENQRQLIITAAVLLTQSWFALSLRMFVRLRLTKSFEIDDWLMAISQAIYTLLCIFVIRSVHFGLGKHNYELSIENQMMASKWKTLATLVYIINMVFIKLSIAFFLLRIATRKPYVWALKVSMVIITIWSIVTFFYYVFICTPIAAQWDRSITNRRCQPAMNFVIAAYSLGGMSIISDWFYALLPIPIILGLQMNMRVKLTLCFIMALGVLASVAAVFRLAFLFHLSDVTDPLCTFPSLFSTLSTNLLKTVNTTQAMIWTLVEPGIAIVASSLVTIKPLLRALRFRGFESSPLRAAYGRSRGANYRNEFSHLGGGEMSTSVSRAKGGAGAAGAGGASNVGNGSNGKTSPMVRRASLMDKFTGKGGEQDLEMEERILESGGTVGSGSLESGGIGVTRTVDVRIETVGKSPGVSVKGLGKEMS
ncbi:hypothetical protein HYFRA_00010804 [Hymenoscyphus fraxineus]|uniref:Rhodopsin domain-containing protein n=1 Tax=Hymenoscyphus fraxineus TaxID=746836 RepID=A0A9N9L381_9HELO|nr:hypothetical protein HYFRA_00010804 [Hymenoscyphus fraxineus]